MNIESEKQLYHVEHEQMKKDEAQFYERFETFGADDGNEEDLVAIDAHKIVAGRTETQRNVVGRLRLNNGKRRIEIQGRTKTKRKKKKRRHKEVRV